MSELAETLPTVLEPGRRAETMRKRMLSPFWIRLFLLTKLPLGFMAGLRVRQLDRDSCRTTVPYGWRTQNPFQSTYFAAQAMAAELSTGVLAMYAVQSAPASVALLITGMEARFIKKATSLATFTCEGGDALFAAVAETVRTGKPVTATVETVGTVKSGITVARFRFTWSFKKRSSR
jgi:hypothetical protein